MGVTKNIWISHEYYHIQKEYFKNKLIIQNGFT